MDTITTTIERKWLSEIVQGRKKIEYREIKPYWSDRLAKVITPFLLRLINGMRKNAPEVTVRIVRVQKNTKRGSYELHIGRIERVRNWDKRRNRPAV